MKYIFKRANKKMVDINFKNINRMSGSNKFMFRKDYERNCFRILKGIYY